MSNVTCTEGCSFCLRLRATQATHDMGERYNLHFNESTFLYTSGLGKRSALLYQHQKLWRSGGAI